MNILHVYRMYYPDPPGGLPEAIRQISLATQTYGVSSTVFTLSTHPMPQKITFAEAKVIRSRSWVAPASCDFGGIDAFRQFSKLAQSADVIHYHYPWPFADLLETVIQPKKPKIITYHSDIVRQKWLKACYEPLMQRMLHAMDAIVATSPPYTQTSSILQQTSLKDRVCVIPLGIDEKQYQDQKESINEKELERLNFDKTKPFFLFIGVLRYYKGVHTLLKAASQVNATIVIAGSGSEMNALQEQSKVLELKNVVFCGQVSEVEKGALLRQCYAFVLPSHLRSEAYGMVLVEASLFGKPMISCEIGTGTSFVNLHHETGWVIEPESPEALAHSMNKLLQNPEQAKQMGKRARERYETLFSSNVLGQAYYQLYKKVLENYR